MATLWDKGKPFDKKAEEFTVGKDRQLDLKLAKWDVTGSKAHVAMLGKIGLLSPDQTKELSDALDQILESVNQGKFHLDDDVEDIHQLTLISVKSFNLNIKNRFWINFNVHFFLDVLS